MAAFPPPQLYFLQTLPAQRRWLVFLPSANIKIRPSMTRILNPDSPKLRKSNNYKEWDL
jgi:hypothetical protein